MKALLEKIREILRSRRTRQMLTRFVSGIAAVVVFVTTYALVLPAITLEQNASCGIPEHQHTDACYEERLVCETPEGEGHHHDASCYDKILICGQEVHVHSPECYQEDSSAVVSSGSAAAASTAFGAAAEQDVLYGTDGSENDTDALVTDSYAAGEDAGEEGVEETTQTAETAAEKSAAEESASDQAVGESGTDNTAAEGSDSGESDAEEADEKRDTVAGEYDAGEAALEESAQDGSDSGIADTEGLKDSEDRNSEENKTADTTDSNEAVNGSASDTSNDENEDAVAAGTEEAANEATTNVLPEPVETENLSAGYVPELDSIELDSVLNKHTDFYYFHPEQGQEIPETSAEVTDWKMVKNGLFGSTKLKSTDLVKMYLSYTIPAGTLNETNQVVRYRLPSNIHLTDEQIIAINETENGMSALYADAADAASNTGEQAQDENQTEDENAVGYQKYLGAEAIEGTRRPDQNLKEGAQEYISAIVKAENVFDDEGIYGEKGAFLGQDLIFVFAPYSIEKNQITYTADGKPISAGEKITGWFACDFNVDQIDWVEQDTDLDNSTVEKTAEIVFVEKDSEKNIKEISRTLKLVDGPEDESDAASGETVDEAQTAASDETATAVETASAADTSASAEVAATADTASEKASEDKAAGAEEKEDAEDGPFKAGTLTADGDGYKITLDYTEKAEIPENAELSVREITAETDKEAYETCLEQAVQQVAADEKTGVDRKASRFFDIEILVRDTDSEGKEETRKIEPAAPVSVNIQIIDDQAAEDSKPEDSGIEDKKSGQSDPTVLHFAEEGVEQIDAAVKDSQEQKGDEDKSTGKESEPAGPATEISFEAESFSVYGVVYTVDFSYSVNGKMYDFSLPGGGFVSFTNLIEVLGIIEGTNSGENDIDSAEVTDQDALTLSDVTVSEETKKFVADVESIEFSNPELVWVGKVETDSTVGGIKEANGLEVQYSAELTEEQIEEINAQTVESGDWALVSILPFLSEESLTVTMKTGEVFTIKVTDAQITKTVIDAKGDTWEITVTYGEDAGIPNDAELKAEEILPEDARYQEYYQKAVEAVSGETAKDNYAHLFDIEIRAGDQKIEPQANVSMSIKLLDAPEDPVSELKVVHFGAEGVEVMETEISGNDETAATAFNSEGTTAELKFMTDEFSVYAVVEPNALETAADVSELDGNMFYVSIDNNNLRYYAKNSLNGNCIAKTNASDISSAALYYFDAVEGTDNQFYIYTIDENGSKKYVRYKSDTSNAFEFSDEATMAFTVEQHTDSGAFYIYYQRSNGNKCAWGYSGNGLIGEVQNARANNKVILTKTLKSDPYGLNGKSYGIIYATTTSGNAMTSTAANSNTRLSGKTMTIKVDPISRTENVYVAKDSNIQMWTFTYISGTEYYITTEVNGALKYLRIASDSISLVEASDTDDNCIITVEEGTGTYSGKYKFSSNGYALKSNGSFQSRADLTTGNDASCWLSFAELSNLNEDDFVTYTATKVSVSGDTDENGNIDYDVKNGDQVIIYTRIWNENTLQYDYYAIDHDGMLVKAYESGDTISWVGTKVNTMLWDFTEYYNDDGTPNYYYELQNAYSGKYIAPQVSGGTFLSDNTIGINMNGRRNGDYYSTIIAWDDPYYDYSALKALNYQLTSAPLSKADTFYFAIMKPDDSEDKLSQVATIDHTSYGITLKMQNYTGTVTGSNCATQTEVLQNTTYNQWNGVKNLLNKYIAEGEEYPTSALTGTSLGQLYGDAMTVNHQFLLSTYQETGYFEFDSTQNFAHLITSESDKWYGVERPDGSGTYEVGDFVVYDQIATTSENNGVTRRHGQFFPYNDLTENSYVNWVNDTDIHGNMLSSLDPRYGEKLYKINFTNKANTDPANAIYFFGMEMDASFMQSESGLDAWGHDLIFEFSGDDDFWLYIDDVLVLDLGGIHSALDGSVNFRTGKVIENGKESTLRERFETAYKAQYPDKTQDEVDAWLDGIFKDGGTVFKDYSGHTMKMYYMERGAGASNIHMRFNLAPYTAGEVLLEKEVSGTETTDSGMLFPFQIFYKDSTTSYVYQPVTGDFSVTDSQDASVPISYAASATVNGMTYEHVFYLKPGQIASIKLPSEETEYYIVECGQDTGTYDKVTINGTENEGTTATKDGYRDYKTAETTVSGQKKVIYDNHVSEDALHSLIVTKKLWREYAKETKITADEDETTFRFRIYIGKDGEDYTVYNTGKYYVKNPAGEYCIYQNGGFVSTGKTVFSELGNTSESVLVKTEQEQATFHTSPGGAADKIPAGYSIEIPGLTDGTAFMVIERSDEIPAGYNLIDYVRSSRETLPEGETANAGVIDRQDETVIVHNQHGYGLTVKKVWSDAAFMDDHDYIYFAVYMKGADDSLTLVDGSVRQLGKTATSLNWFFPELTNGKTLNDYLVYEITLSGDYTVDEAGKVTLGDGCTVTKIEENGTLTVGGTTNEHGYSDKFDYTASYSRQELTEAQLADTSVNSRTDTVTNTRPGIKLVKTDLSGAPLEGAKFTLVKSGNEASKKTFTSDEAGLIAVAYLTSGEEYILTETAAPYKYLSLIDSLTIKVENGTLYVNGETAAAEGACYSIKQVAEPTATDMPTVTISNRAFTLTAVKKDAVNNEAISGVTFALYNETTDYYTGNPMRDYYPKDGFETLVTDENGVIPKIDLDHLAAGTYYLHETGTPTTYQQADYDIRLTISATGQVTIQKAVSTYDSKTKTYSWTFSDIESTEAEVITEADGNVTLVVKNQPAKGVQILKVGDGLKTNPLSGAEFALYKITQISDDQPKDGETPILTGTTDEKGILNLGALDSSTTYYLYETKAPDGYNMLTAPVRIITMSGGKISAYLTGPLDVTTIEEEDRTEVVRIQVSNSSGYELPSTGGPGTWLYTILGSILILGAGVLLWRRRRLI